MRFNYRKKNRMIAAFLAAALFIGLFPSIPVMATTTSKKITEAQKKAADAKKELDSVNKEISSLEKKQANVLAEINSLDNELDELVVNLELLANDIEIKEGEIEEAEVELEEAIERENAQYDAMKLRIQYIYEEGDINYIALLLEAKSLAQFLTRADYASEIHEQDRQLLDAYVEAKEEVEALKAQLEEEMVELEAVKEEYEEEKEQTEAKLAEKEAQSENYSSLLSAAKSKAAAYKKTINEQNTAIKKLQDEQRRAQIAAGGSSSGGGATVVGGGSGAAIANYAMQFIGNPYVYGGSSLTNGTDCSGFTMSVFRHFGISLPHSSGAQASCGRGVSYSEAQPGDLICYSGHVGIYIGGGRIVHASTPKTGITTCTATYRSILAVRRCY